MKNGTSVRALEPGQRVNRLTVLAQVPPKVGSANRARRYSVQCFCGAVFEARSDNLKSGKASSCGCQTKGLLSQAMKGNCNNVKHGMTGTPTHRAWINMMQRSHWKSDLNSPNYAERGISVCDRWAQSFEAFLADMGPKPAGMTLDRENNDRGYEPGNCRWVTQKVQQNNRTTNNVIEQMGELLTVAQWAERFGLKRSTLSKRLHRGDSIGRALRPV